MKRAAVVAVALAACTPSEPPPQSLLVCHNANCARATDPFTELPPASATSLKTRLDEASAVWIEYMNLMAVNG